MLLSVQTDTYEYFYQLQNDLSVTNLANEQLGIEKTGRHYCGGSAEITVENYEKPVDRTVIRKAD